MRMVLLAALLALFFIGCQKETDVERPTSKINLPQNGQVIWTADGLHLLANLTDNSGILQYKITLTGIDSLNDIGSDSTLSFIFIEGVPNKEKEVLLNQFIELSANTFNGHYALTLACIDADGNESLRDTVLFEIRNSIDSDPPVFNVGGPTVGDTLDFGSGFSPNGSVSDSQSLIYSDIYIGRTNGSDTILYFQFPSITDNAVNYDGIGWYFQVDSSWTQGAYHVYYTAWDNYSGVSHSIPFNVKY